MVESVFQRGLKIRREVVGEAHVERAFERAGAFGGAFQELVTEYCWGASWGRDALSRRDRSLLNLAIIGTLSRPTEFRLHVEGAVKNGVTDNEIKDTLIHLAIYAGIPAGVEAFRFAGDVLRERDDQQAATHTEGDTI